MTHLDYDRIAATYDGRYHAGGPAGIAEALQMLASQVHACRVLDVGCGTGYWLAGLTAGPLRCGLDLSRGMLSIARQRDRDLHLVRGRAARLPFPSAAFDLVFCVHALHHFDNPSAFVQDARRVLRPGGALAVVGIDPQAGPDRWYVYDYFPGTWETDRGRYPTVEMIRHWMVEAGLVRCEGRQVARILHDWRGDEVWDDPVLHKDGTSQLSLLSDAAFEAGLGRIRAAIRQAQRDGRGITFSTDIAVPLVAGFVP